LREKLNRLRSLYFVEKMVDYWSLKGIETTITITTIKEPFRIDCRLEVEIHVRKTWDLKNFVMCG